MSSKQKDFYNARKELLNVKQAIYSFFDKRGKNLTEEDVKIARGYVRNVIVMAEDVGDFKVAHGIYQKIKKHTMFHPNYLRKNPTTHKNILATLNLPKLTKDLNFKLVGMDRKDLKESFLEDITLHN